MSAAKFGAKVLPMSVAIEAAIEARPDAASDPFFSRRVAAHVRAGVIRNHPYPSKRPDEQLTLGDVRQGHVA